MNRSVCILIVGYRCAADIRNCLESLSLSSHAAFEVQVCENGGEEAFRELVDELASVADFAAAVESSSSRSVVETRAGQLGSAQRLHVHRARDNLGYAGGVNAMIDQIAGDPNWTDLWVLNPDTTIHPDALAKLVAYADDPAYGIVASRLMSADSGQVEVYAGRWRKWMARGFNLGLGRPGDEMPDVAAVERAMDYVPGAAMFVTRSYLDAVGPMDERYFLYNEEIDWCFRRGERRLGYAHDSIVYHQHGATIGSSHDRKDRSALSVYLDERNKLLFTRRFFPVEYPIVLCITLVLTAQYLAAGAYANFAYALRGWCAGLLGRSGRPDWLLPTAPEPNANDRSSAVVGDTVPLASGSRR